MHIHILGICGTFMGGLAVLAKQLGHTVSGSDQYVYPPMSTQLREQGIELMEGYCAENIDHNPDIVIIGNALSRGNPEVEAVLNKGLRYVSGAQWLAEEVLQGKWVLAVAGTHGKTTTTSMLAWILEYCGFKPGFLIGGIPLNFNVSARLGDSAFFVVEADEYDCAFFDKRSKFIHYHPRTAIFNNLEYDHADIFPDLDAIKQQFHYLVRTIPSGGLIISPVNEQAIDDVLAMGCWTRLTKTAIGKNVQWNAQLRHADGSEFAVFFQGQEQGVIQWALTGEHNVYNALAAIAAAKHVGINPEDAVMALHQFKNAKRRMEVLARIGNVTVYDDFAHHPTAIATTLDGLRKRVWQDRIIAVVEPRSNTMRLGVHADKLAEALQQADLAIIYAPNNLGWNAHALANQADNIVIYSTIDDIIERLKIEATQEDGGHFVLMSNGDFGGIYQRLQSALTEIL